MAIYAQPPSASYGLTAIRGSPALSQFHKIARRGPRQLIAIYAQAQSQFDKIARPRSGAVPAPSS